MKTLTSNPSPLKLRKLWPRAGTEAEGGRVPQQLAWGLGMNHPHEDSTARSISPQEHMTEE